MALPRSLAVWVVLLAPLAAQLPRSPEDLPADVRQTLTARMGGDPFTVLGAWQRAPRDAEPPPWLPDQREGDDAWHWLLHTALWHADPDVAYAAARMLSYPQLDLPASERWITVVWPHIFDAEDAPDWGEVRRQVSSTDVARLLAVRDCWHAEVRPFFLGDMHRCMRPEFAPLLAALALCDDPFLRRGGFGNLGTIAGYSDQHRDVIGKALLALQAADLADPVEPFVRAHHLGHTPRAYQLPAARPGWSPLLRAALQRSFLELDRPLFWPFLMRWAEDETPADEDRLLLAALLDCGKQEGCWLALRTMARMPVDPHLQRRVAALTAPASEALVLAARHDWPALRELAATDEEALAVALEYDFDATFLAWSAVAFGADAAAGLAAVDRLLGVADALAAPCRTNPLLPARLRQAIALFGERLDFPRLHRLASELPAARSERLIELYWAAVTPANLADCDAAVFEVSPSIALRDRLREWGASPQAAVRAPALDLLLRLGDARLDQAVIEHWQAHHGDDPLLLARCREAASVRTFLADCLRRQPADADGAPSVSACNLLAAVAMAGGLPDEVAEHWAGQLSDERQSPRVRERFAHWREQALDGDYVTALLDHHGALPIRQVPVAYLGLVDDDRVRELLQKVRSTPGAAVQGAIDELALGGDWRCKQEVDELRHRHVYGWFDDATSPVQVGGRSLDLVPWLLGELETNCCRRNSAASALEYLYGFETHAVPENALQTQAARARAHWQAVGEHLRWSVIAGRFVVAAH
ncbi:MAG: hypothetical protein FJ265_12020 [Planctomycetes bacterium]|nr:hypothetical protein [Planctomycetota bacterium]